MRLATQIPFPGIFMAFFLMTLLLLELHDGDMMGPHFVYVANHPFGLSFVKKGITR